MESSGLERSDSALEASPAERGRALVRLAVPFYGLMAAIGWAWRGGFRGESILLAPGIEGAEVWPLAEAVGLGVALGLGIVVVSAAWTAWLPSGRELSRFLGETIGEVGLGACLVLALVSGFAEEALFRGAVQPEVGLLAASVLFGAMHLVPRWPFVLWSVYAAVIGLVLGQAFVVTGSLWTPVAAHVVVNGINLPLLSRRYGRAAAPLARSDQDWGGPPGDVETGADAAANRHARDGSAADHGDGIHLDESAER